MHPFVQDGAGPSALGPVAFIELFDEAGPCATAFGGIGYDGGHALKRRGVPDLTASVAAQLGALTLKIAYERWSDAANGDEFNEVARRTLTELQAASASC